MISIFLDNGSGEQDITRYVQQETISIVDAINVPTTIDFTLVNIDDLFEAPKRGSYVRIYSTKFLQNLATGFVTGEPERVFIGLSNRVPSMGFQQMEFHVQATSDEWLLNVKAVPFLPAFLGQTMGQILQILAETIAPGFFDYSGIQDGNTVPYFKYDPTQKWADIAKSFGDSARYRYKVMNRQIFFTPFGDAPLGITYDETAGEGTFDPKNLRTSLLTVPPVNEAIVFGQAEPQTIHRDYFVGDGFTGNFPLRHSVFNGATNLLLQDDWTGTSFSTQNWNVRDPFGQFTLAGALNVVTSASGLAFGQSYVLAQNGLELGGHLALQHGDFIFTDICKGIIGGVYSGTTTQGFFATGSCVAGFLAFTAQGDTVVASPSGATNVSLQPIVDGVPAGTIVKTQINHQYILTTYIDAKRYSRYNQIYNTLAGTQFGDQDLPAVAQITFVIEDFDQGNPFNPPTETKFSVSVSDLPSFGLYAIVTPQQMTFAVNYTLLSRPPQGLLQVAGLLTATGGQLPIRTPGAYVPYSLGFGQSKQIATISNGNDTDQLSFYAGLAGVNGSVYASTLPGPGARIAFESWESGTSLADVYDPTAAAAEAVVTGDDGRRTAIFTDLTPSPRTSEECDLAASAVITDRSSPQYQGSYTVYDYFWNGFRDDYPTSGRFLFVNSPQRNIVKQNFFVNSVTTKVAELAAEVLTFEIAFGQDLFLEKLLKRFIVSPTSVLEPQDTAVQPTLQTISEVGATFLGNLDNAQATSITGTSATIDLGAPPLSGCEVRRADYGWGIADQNLVGVFTTQTFSLSRTSYEQIYYLRQVNGALTSRFTTVIRVVQPLVPAAPTGVIDATNPLQPNLQLSFTGDIRNIALVEVRGQDNTTVLYQKRVFSTADLFFSGIQSQLGLQFYCYFINMCWEYSPVAVITETIEGFLAPNSLGPNLINNPGFELSSLGYGGIWPNLLENAFPSHQSLGTPTIASYIADGWHFQCYNEPSFVQGTAYQGGTITSSPRSGAVAGFLSFKSSSSVSDGESEVAELCYPAFRWQLVGDVSNLIPVKRGDVYLAGGYALWSANTLLPAGLTPFFSIGVRFFDSAGNVTSGVLPWTGSADGSSPTLGGSYAYQATVFIAPNDAAFMQFYAQVVLQNTRGSLFFAGGGTNKYLDVRFDDMFLQIANRGTSGRYRPTTNPLTSNDIGGGLASITVAGFHMQNGLNSINYTGGTVVGTEANSTKYYIYFDDPTQAGGVVTYNATQFADIAILGENRFFVGSITTADGGGGATSGNNDGGWMVP